MNPIQHYTTNYSLVIYCTIMKRIGALDPSVKKVCEEINASTPSCHVLMVPVIYVDIVLKYLRCS